MKSDGKAYPVSPDAKTPFAVVMFFDPTVKVIWEESVDWKGFQTAVDKAVPSRNVFYAVKVRAIFDYIRVRTVPRQQKPYPPLVEVAKTQPEFTHEAVEGTLVGFRFPDYTQGVNVAGYHVHFLNGGLDAGGHVLDFRMRDASIDIDVTSELHMELPDCGDFLSADLDKDHSEAIHQAEN
jgi:acetolactate decarboxylase